MKVKIKKSLLKEAVEAVMNQAPAFQIGPDGKLTGKKYSDEQIMKAKQNGSAKKTHWGRPEDMLRPRGSMKKESIGLIILQKLQDNFSSWTSKVYGDSISQQEAMQILKKNLNEQVQAAFNQFLSSIG